MAANKLLNVLLMLIGVSMGLLNESLAATCLTSQSPEEQRSLEIRVLDSQRQAIVEADLVIFDGKLGKKLKLDESGIARIKERAGVIVARANGFQYGGLVIDNLSSDHLNLILKRVDEAGAGKRTLPLPLAADQRAKLYEELLEKTFLDLEQAKDMQSQALYLQILGKHRPDRMLEFLEENPDLPSPVVVTAKREAIKTLARQDSEQAIELVVSLKEPMFQVMGLKTLVKALPKDSKQLSSCETQWLRSLEQIREPQLKLAAAASAAEYFQSCGKQDQAKRIVDTYLEQVEKLPSAGWAVYPRSLFAALIVPSDPERARKILSEFNPASEQELRESLRGQARLAFAASRLNLELTLQLLAEFDEMDTTKSNSGYRFKVLQMLAERYPKAAIELARKLTDLNWRAWTLGIIADRIGDKSPELARKTLAEAAEAAIESAASPPSGQPSLNHPATILGGLLPIAEKVAPDLVESMIWQTVWCAVPQSRFVVSGPSHSHAIQQSAGTICRYDRELGLALFGDRQLNQGSSNDGNSAVVFVLKPEGITDHLKRLSANQLFSIYRARETLLNLLAEDEQSAWNRVSLPFPMEWKSDEFEER